MNGKLILKDGTTFEGKLYGAEQFSEGEVVFTTGMVGYEDSITDPSFKDQLVTFTFPLIGNYGVPDMELDEHGLAKYFESEKVHLKGIIVNEYSENFSHHRGKSSLSEFLKQYNVPILSGIDTRKLTEYLRENGSQPGRIVPDNSTDALPETFYDPNTKNLVAEVSPKEPKVYSQGEKTVVVLDCGVKNNTLRFLLREGLTVLRVPFNYDFFEHPILKADGTPYHINGLFVSNGPGDPEILDETVKIIQKAIAKDLPIFGICLGNQLLARAAGAKTFKLKFGHRGQNQPCIQSTDKLCYMTSQNHGYAIDPKTLPSDFEVLFFHANDDTIEGIKHKSKPFFAAQFHPEASPGPVDTNYLFKQFFNNL